MSDTVGVEFYATVSLKENRWAAELTIPKVTKNKPSIPKGAVALKLHLQVPRSLFEEFIPSGTITLPEDAAIGRPAIEVFVPEGVEVTTDVRLALVPWAPADTEEE